MTNSLLPHHPTAGDRGVKAGITISSGTEGFLRGDTNLGNLGSKKRRPAHISSVSGCSSSLFRGSSLDWKMLSSPLSQYPMFIELPAGKHRRRRPLLFPRARGPGVFPMPAGRLSPSDHTVRRPSARTVQRRVSLAEYRGRRDRLATTEDRYP
jgi:hypothetical protein